MSSRRPSLTRNIAPERPRTKGWRGAEAFDQADADDAMPPRPLVAAPRRSQPAARQHEIARVGRFLTPQQVESVRAIMRLFLEEDLARGVPRDRQLLCQCCGVIKWAAGFVLYGRSAFCNECATELELSRLRGRCDSAAEFLAWRADQAAG
jgi:hypothetical protein